MSEWLLFVVFDPKVYRYETKHFDEYIIMEILYIVIYTSYIVIVYAIHVNMH